jgi:ATP-binding cassette subfamily B protein
MIRMLFLPCPVLTGTTIFLKLLVSVSPVITALLLRQLVDSLESGISLESMKVFFIFTLIFLGVRSFLQGCSQWIQSVHDQTFTDWMSLKIQKKSMEIPYHYYESSQYHDTLHRAQDEARHRFPFLLNHFMQMLCIALSLLIFLIYLSQDYGAVSAILVLSVIPGLVMRIYRSRWYVKQKKLFSSEERRAEYYHYLLINTHSAKEIRNFGFGNWLSTKFMNLRENLRERVSRIEFRLFLMGLLSDFLAVVLLGAAVFMLVQEVQLGNSSTGGLVMCFHLILKSFEMLKSFFSSSGVFMDNLFFLENLDDFFAISAAIPDVNGSRIRHSKVEFRGVGFHYPGTGDFSLKDINFTLEQGDILLIKGENGSGKTTLARIICGLFQPQTGEIFLDGADTAKGELDVRQRCFSVLWQDFGRYSFSLKENVGFSECCLQQVLKQAGVKEFSDGLPQGVDTLLGKEFDSGTDLSFGQWQRVAFARALNQDRQFFILDEPTSFLDSAMRERLITLLKDFSKKAVVIISHDPEFEKIATKTITLQSGRIVPNE